MQEEFLSELPQLSNDQVREIEQEITLEDVTESLKTCDNAKSPGIDGIPYEFYKMMPFLLKPMLEFFKYSMAKRSLSELNKTCLITLIPKNAQFQKLENWRPISLLNTDVKLLNKIIAAKVNWYLDQLIDENQPLFAYLKRNLKNLLN